MKQRESIKCLHCNYTLGNITETGSVHQKTKVQHYKFPKQSISPASTTTLGCPKCGKITKAWETTNTGKVEFTREDKSNLQEEQ